MRVFGLILILALFSLSAFAQSESVTKPHKNYFMIDGSGSMKEKHSLLEATVERRLEQTRQNDSNSVIIPTIFGATGREECAAPISIESPLDDEGSIVIPNENYKQSTPLGAALLAATLDAGDDQATILLFSDEGQTDGCGIDVCAVARYHLPRDNIDVRSVAVGASPEDHDRVGCIEGAQASSKTHDVRTGRSATKDSGSEGGFVGTAKWWLPFIGVLSVLPFVILLLLSETQKNEAIAGKEQIPPRWRKITAGWVFFVIAIVCLTFTFTWARQDLSRDLPFVYALLNDRLSSGFITSAILGFLGWVLLQVWSNNKFRQETANQKHLKALAEEKREKQQAERASTFKNVLKPRLKRRRANLLSKAIVKEMSKMKWRSKLPNDVLLDLSQTVSSVRNGVEKYIDEFSEGAEVDQKLALESISNLSREDYVKVVDSLVELGRLDQSLADEVNQFFEAWNALLTNNADEPDEAINAIRGFDVKRLS